MQRRQLFLGLLALSLLPHSGCAEETNEDEPSGLKIACIGDSITFGLGLKNRKEECYPAQLQGLLGKGVQVQNFGISGTTLLKKGDHPYWNTKKYHNSIQWRPEIVVIKLGTNDTKPKNWKHKDQLANDLETMISAFRLQPEKPEIFVCLPVPAFPERWGIRDTVIKNELIPIIRKVATEQKCHLIDLYAALEGKKQFFPDQVHPNKEGAALIAKTVAAALKKNATGLKSKQVTKEAPKPDQRPPFAEDVPGKYGLVYSPYVANKSKGLVSVTDENDVRLPKGTEVSDPHTGKLFRVP